MTDGSGDGDLVHVMEREDLMRRVEGSSSQHTCSDRDHSMLLRDVWS